MDFDDSENNAEWFDFNHLNLQNDWITLVRKFWYLIFKSRYSDADVESARINDELRLNILDDIDRENNFASWEKKLHGIYCLNIVGFTNTT